MAAVGFIYPQLAFASNAIISTFPGTASMMSGIAAGVRALGIPDCHVVGFAGDGGTADIGLQALSGAIDRHDRIIYICYDNEAYMNTGVQKSGLTPFGARTSTTPAGQRVRGSVTRKKNMFEVVAAHGIDYAATASVGYPQDFLNKVNKAKSVNGTSYIHVFAPCPTGWGAETDLSIELGKKWWTAAFGTGGIRRRTVSAQSQPEGIHSNPVLFREADTLPPSSAGRRGTHHARAGSALGTYP